MKLIIVHTKSGIPVPLNPLHIRAILPKGTARREFNAQSYVDVRESVPQILALIEEAK